MTTFRRLDCLAFVVLVLAGCLGEKPPEADSSLSQTPSESLASPTPSHPLASSSPPVDCVREPRTVLRQAYFNWTFPANGNATTWFNVTGNETFAWINATYTAQGAGLITNNEGEQDYNVSVTAPNGSVVHSNVGVTYYITPQPGETQASETWSTATALGADAAGPWMVRFVGRGTMQTRVDFTTLAWEPVCANPAQP